MRWELKNSDVTVEVDEKAEELDLEKEIYLGGIWEGTEVISINFKDLTQLRDIIDCVLKEVKKTKK